MTEQYLQEAALNLTTIRNLADSLGLDPQCLKFYGEKMAKIQLSGECVNHPVRGKLILVTAMTPTPAGEGKTTMSIGLADALSRLGKKTLVALREPSLGPVFGMKGGATGGGKARVIPSDEINLHFTGDLHAITSAHNLLAAMVDNRLHFDGACGLLDSRLVTWKRVLDMDDRVLREVIVGVGGPLRGLARETGFDITAASEVMAILCLSTSISDLKERLGNILIGYSPDRKPVFARQINAHGAMAALLKDAIHPNLVQTLEGTPAIIHGGPFANIAHGTNSIIATRTALSLGEFVVTECGFGSDLGAEKFFDIVVRTGKIPAPSVCVLVGTVRAMKLHGGVDLKELDEENVKAVTKGFVNLHKHIENMRGFGVPVVVALNRFNSDTENEIRTALELCENEKIPAAVSEVFSRGGKGAEALAREVLTVAEREAPSINLTYSDEMSLYEKIEAVALKIYGAKGIAMEGKIRRKLRQFEAQGFGSLPVCIAKTQYSLSDDAELLGKPEGFTLIVTDVSVSAGAGFVVVYCGDIMTMPGLPKVPSAEGIDVDSDGNITGLS
ncbi:MAG TPA: formate--tetrahydrofolate ligase [Thermoanaerobaculia bacterium]|nr:formate--tetrahydrofolate ligase [Thermoanaerobaculia bacterium]HUM30856.1 formate--tetrahydrofolate ligase [Thermoanaerobaculia bacterium]HXK69243.1 formate--tetrahydrofolate ligase [Thermoanaerobaculia bacterium]